MHEADDTRITSSPKPCGGRLLERLADDILGVDKAIGGSVWVRLLLLESCRTE